jgi:hypothetical protein
MRIAIMAKARPAARQPSSLTNGRVPHISLVFREMWDTTNVDRSVRRVNQESEGRCSGIPHLAKNERDMGHPAPGLCGATQLRKSAIAATTISCSSKVSWGNIGSARTSAAARSLSGKAPGAYPRLSNAGC